MPDYQKDILKALYRRRFYYADIRPLVKCYIEGQDAVQAETIQKEFSLKVAEMSNEGLIKTKKNSDNAPGGNEVFLKLTQKGRSEYITSYRYKWIKLFFIDLLNFSVRYIYTVILSIVLFILVLLWLLNYLKILN